jgi:hypothetical protein
MAELRPIRLIRRYRSFAAGDVIQATPQLARRLIALGVAAEDSSARPSPRSAVERAVAPGPMEVR